MSATAPWIALAVDWSESEMFGPLPRFGMPEKATDGERLAWVSLLCYAKQIGRGGTISFRKSALMKLFSLSERSVEGMLKRAQKCAAITIDGEQLSICNWRVYQQRGYKHKAGESGEHPPSPHMGATVHSPQSTSQTDSESPLPPYPDQPPEPAPTPNGTDVGSALARTGTDEDPSQVRWLHALRKLSGLSMKNGRAAVDMLRQIHSRGGEPDSLGFMCDVLKRAAGRGLKGDELAGYVYNAMLSEIGAST